MNEFVSKINFGKRVTLHHKVFVDNIVRIEYIQGIFKGMENDVYVIEQHFPFNNLLLGGKTDSIERRIHTSDVEGKVDVF